jgi:hypothetical protein
MRLQATVGAEVAVALLAHRTVRCYTGRPVNYSEAAPRIPEGEQFRVGFPGAPDSPVHQTRAHFGCLLLSLFEPFLGLFIGLL